MTAILLSCMIRIFWGRVWRYLLAPRRGRAGPRLFWWGDCDWRSSSWIDRWRSVLRLRPPTPARWPKSFVSECQLLAWYPWWFPSSTKSLSRYARCAHSTPLTFCSSSAYLPLVSTPSGRAASSEGSAEHPPAFSLARFFTPYTNRSYAWHRCDSACGQPSASPLFSLDSSQAPWSGARGPAAFLRPGFFRVQRILVRWSWQFVRSVFPRLFCAWN